MSAILGRSLAISFGRISLMRYSETPMGCCDDSSAHLTIVLSFVLQTSNPMVGSCVGFLRM